MKNYFDKIKVSESPYKKLTKADYPLIEELANKHMSVEEMAPYFDMSKNTFRKRLSEDTTARMLFDLGHSNFRELVNNTFVDAMKDPEADRSDKLNAAKHCSIHILKDSKTEEIAHKYIDGIDLRVTIDRGDGKGSRPIEEIRDEKEKQLKERNKDE